jgi:hypothetical protein
LTHSTRKFPSKFIRFVSWASCLNVFTWKRRVHRILIWSNNHAAETHDWKGQNKQWEGGETIHRSKITVMTDADYFTWWIISRRWQHLAYTASKGRVIRKNVEVVVACFAVKGKAIPVTGRGVP